MNQARILKIVVATFGALLTTRVTFFRCFLWIFLGAPHIEALRGNKHLTSALTSITATVVGVVLNLAIWFGLHVLFPSEGVVDWSAFVVSVVAFVGRWRWNWNLIAVVLGSGLVGLIYTAAR